MDGIGEVRKLVRVEQNSHHMLVALGEYWSIRSTLNLFLCIEHSWWLQIPATILKSVKNMTSANNRIIEKHLGKKRVVPGGEREHVAVAGIVCLLPSLCSPSSLFGAERRRRASLKGMETEEAHAQTPRFRI